MMQSSSRIIFRSLKNLNYSACNTFLHASLSKHMLLKNAIYKNISISKCLTAAPILPKRKLVSNIEDLKKYITEKQFYLKLLTNILDNIRFENISPEDARLLLAYCGSSVADSSKQIRDNVCQNIYKRLLTCNKLDLDICHSYIKTCTDNGVVINCEEFFSQIKHEPTQKTYKLLLDNVCEKGDIGQALQLLETMKVRAISANEEMFNKLVLAHTIRGGAQSGETVLYTMRTAQVTESMDTKFAILKGVLQRNNSDDVDYVLNKHPIDLTEGQLLELLEILGLTGNISWLSKIKHLYEKINITRDYINSLRKMCIHLVHMNMSENAMAIYQEFVDPEADQNYGFFILREMLHCNVDTERIIRLIKHLSNNNLNNYSLENLTELALRHNYTEVSWMLLENMSTLRPHFFWPLLLDANRKQGEIGIFNVLQKMVDMDVKIDSETLQFYVLPFCALDDLKLLIKKLLHFKITLKEAVGAVLIILLRNKQVKQAAELCERYDVKISGDKLFKLISSSWIISKDKMSVVYLLQRYCESNDTQVDLVGDFLTETLNSCKSTEDFKHYVELLDLIHKRKLRISGATAENLQKLSSTKCKSSEISEKIKDTVDVLLDFGLNSEQVPIPHPRNMTINELECHLLELQGKKMETRGVLRKLIQLHANLGNLDRATELRKEFLSSGYEETIGMKSSLMYNYVKKGYLEEALNIFNEIKSRNPDFKIDDFKIIDLANLLVKQEKYGEAMDLLKMEAVSKKIIGGPALEKNCWQLLNSFENAEEQLRMFKFLVESGYCKPTNVIFGPLIRIHLKRGDLKKSVNIYVNCAEGYKCTPLQLEIVKELSKRREDSLLQQALDATRKVHGLVSTQTVLITALAENGEEKALQKIFTENKLNIKDELQKRCNRWIQEGKVDALKTLASVCERLPKEAFDVNFIYKCILQTYSLNHDYKNALKFYDQLLEKEDVVIDKQLERELDKLKSYKLKENINNV